MPEPSSVLITGAAGVIGRAAFKLLSAQGYPLVLVDRDAAAVESLAASLGRASWMSGDATDAGDMATIFAKAAPDLGSVVLAVGAEGPVGAIEDCDDDDFHRTMTLNVTSVWLGLKAALKVLKPKGQGSIVVLSSISGSMGMPMMSAYSVSKHAVLGLVRSAAREAAASGVQINANCPCNTPNEITSCSGVRGLLEPRPALSASRRDISGRRRPCSLVGAVAR
jgi:NAD(P)-dependent dehydrogenase (short-subunit alcohol dehydrogenase family)